MGQVWVAMPLVASRFTAVAFFCCVVSLFVVVYVIFLFIAFAPVIREPLTAASRHRQRGEVSHVGAKPSPDAAAVVSDTRRLSVFQLKVCELFPICYDPRQPRIPAVEIAPGDGVPVAGLRVMVALVYG